MAKDAKQTPAEETEVPTLAVGDCLKDECKCLHEHGLVEVTTADGTKLQMTVQQAQEELKKQDSIKQALDNYNK